MTILIAGGGIGGLTLALMLHKRGLKPIVYEQATQIRELGVGINILPHAIKDAVLAEVGACACSMARNASLVLVLPTEPVTLATLAALRIRPAWPRATSAFIVSPTLMTLPTAPGTSRDTIAAAAPRASASAT